MSYTGTSALSSSSSAMSSSSMADYAAHSPRDGESSPREKVSGGGGGGGDGSRRAESTTAHAHNHAHVHVHDDSSVDAPSVRATERAFARTLRQEVPIEAFIHEYDHKVEGVKLPVTSRLTAALDLSFALLKTGAEASAFAVTYVVNKALDGLTALGNRFDRLYGAAHPVRQFLGISRESHAQYLDVLKTQAKGILYSGYAIASPQRAIDAAKKDKSIGSTENEYSKKFWGQPANGTRNYALLSNFYKWGGVKA